MTVSIDLKMEVELHEGVNETTLISAMNEEVENVKAEVTLVESKVGLATTDIEETTECTETEDEKAEKKIDLARGGDALGVEVAHSW